MIDFVDLGPAPTLEECAKPEQAGYEGLSRKECEAHVAQLRRVFGPEPAGAELAVVTFTFQSTQYLSVICYFDEDVAQSEDYARRCTAQGPQYWDADALRQLANARRLC